MNAKQRLTRLEVWYRRALSGSVVAKAKYLALEGAIGVNTIAANRAKERWQILEERKSRIANRMNELTCGESEVGRTGSLQIIQAGAPSP